MNSSVSRQYWVICYKGFNGKLVKTVWFIWVMKVGKVYNITRPRRKGQPETPKDRAADSRVRFYCNNTEPWFSHWLTGMKWIHVSRWALQQLIETGLTAYRLVGLPLCYTTILPMETRPGTHVITLHHISKSLVSLHDFTIPLLIHL